jgi:hypothetical protein
VHLPNLLKSLYQLICKAHLKQEIISVTTNDYRSKKKQIDEYT